MKWNYPANRDVPDIGLEVIAVETNGNVTLAKRNEGYWWTDLYAGEDMRPPLTWTEHPTVKE